MTLGITMYEILKKFTKTNKIVRRLQTRNHDIIKFEARNWRNKENNSYQIFDSIAEINMREENFKFLPITKLE